MCLKSHPTLPRHNAAFIVLELVNAPMPGFVIEIFLVTTNEEDQLKDSGKQ